MKDTQYLNKCLKKIKEKVQWGEFDTWTTHNFELLSEYVHEASGISISSRTLRRLLKSKRVSNPQIATKNALSQYLGYNDWEDFKQNVNHKRRPETSDNQSNNYFQPRTFVQASYFPWLVMAASVPVIIFLTIIIYPEIQIILNKYRVDFRSNETIGAAPYESTFYYDVTKLKASNIMIDRNFYDDGDGELVPIEKYRHYYKTTFDQPDYYAVKIIAGGERIKCVGVHVITKGWDYLLGDTYFQNTHDDLMTNGALRLPEELEWPITFEEANEQYVEYRNIRSFNAQADNLVFKARFRNNGYENFNDVCKESRVELINKHGRISFNFLDPGCAKANINAEFSERIMNGEFDDLNSFIQDVSYWRNLEIKTNNKNVTVLLDNVEIYNTRYNVIMDELMGISFAFKGIGEIDFVEVYNNQGEMVYQDMFQVPDDEPSMNLMGMK